GIMGAELEVVAAPLPRLNLRGALSIQKGEYTDFPNGDILRPNPEPPFGDTHETNVNLKGRETVRTPPLTANLGGDYRFPAGAGTVLVAANLSYNDGYFFAVDNNVSQHAYTLLNASVTWTSPNGSYDVKLWGKNLTDDKNYTAIIQQDLGDLYTPAATTTLCITMRGHF